MKKVLEKVGIRKIIQIVAALPFMVLLINNFQYSAILFIVLAALGGSFYCGYICPFGLLQELVSLLGKKLKIKKREVPEKLDRVLRGLRYVLFILFAVLGLSIIYTLLTYDARANLFSLLTGKTVTVIMVVSILVFAGLSLFYNKIFCKYFCITGAKYGLLSYFRFFTIKRNADTCINCKLCDKSCDMGIKISTCDETVNSMNCINCFECVKKCPKPNTLTYGFVPPSKLKKKVAFAAAAIVVVVGFNFFNGNNSSEVAADSTETASETSAETVYYEGTGTGFNGDVVVSVGVSGTEILSIDIEDNVDDAAFFERAEEGVIPEIIAAQSTEVDVVSGATYSSNGIIDAVADALSGVTISVSSSDETTDATETSMETEVASESTATEEGTPPTDGTGMEGAPPEDGTGTEESAEPTEIVPGVAENIESGIYTGVGTGYNGDITVAVEVLEGFITDIIVTDYVDDTMWLARAENGVVSDIIATQSTEVDVVTSATTTSEGIIEAVENALSIVSTEETEVEEAKVTEETTITVEETTTPAETTTAVEETTTPAETTTVEETTAPAETTTVVEETTAPAETTIVVEETTAPAASETVVYTGTGTGFRGETEVEVTVTDGEIIDITVVDYEDDQRWFENAWSGVVSDILSSQSTDVDTVSGATYSSKGIIEAVKDALGL